MAVTELNQNPYLAMFSPVGLLVARLLSGLSETTLREMHKILWWVHFFLAIGLIAAIPFTKLRHLFTTPINYLFADLREKGSLETINLEAADADHFGVVDPCRPDLEGYLRCGCLHQLQALPGPLSGLGYRQAAFAHESRAADR